LWRRLLSVVSSAGEGELLRCHDPRKYPEELLERARRLVFESGCPIAYVARDLGVPSETLRVYVRRVEANEGRREGVLSDGEREEIRKLRRENSELRRASEILKSASVFFAKELDLGGRGDPASLWWPKGVLTPVDRRRLRPLAQGASPAAIVARCHS
jgi:transposase